jgi:hypothetical protein
VFDKQIKSLTSLSYRITGPMSEPDIKFEWIAPPDKKTGTAIKTTGGTK